MIFSLFHWTKSEVYWRTAINLPNYMWTLTKCQESEKEFGMPLHFTYMYVCSIGKINVVVCIQTVSIWEAYSIQTFIAVCLSVVLYNFVELWKTVCIMIDYYDQPTLSTPASSRWLSDDCCCYWCCNVCSFGGPVVETDYLCSSRVSGAYIDTRSREAMEEEKKRTWNEKYRILLYTFPYSMSLLSYR